MSEEEILNWRYEEQKYIDKEIKKYTESLNVFALMFMTKKQNQKNVDYITKKAKLKYRENKLDKMLKCINQERARINDRVSFANKELNKILSEISGILPDKEMFEIKTRIYDNGNIHYSAPMEIKTIELKPYRIQFMQQKLY